MKRIVFRLVITAAVAGLGILAVGPVPGATAAVPSGSHEIRSPWRPGECLQAGPATGPRGPVLMMRPCDTGVHQRWSFEPTRATQQPTFQRVRNVAWGMCLDADNRGGRLTRFVNVFQCNDSPNQAWAFPEPGNQGIVCVLVAPACDLKLLQTTTAAPACLTGPEATALCSLAHVSRNRVNGMADDHTGPEFLAPYTVTLDGIGVFYSVNDETWFVWPATVRN